MGSLLNGGYVDEDTYFCFSLMVKKKTLVINLLEIKEGADATKDPVPGPDVTVV